MRIDVVPCSTLMDARSFAALSYLRCDVSALCARLVSFGLVKVPTLLHLDTASLLTLISAQQWDVWDASPNPHKSQPIPSDFLDLTFHPQAAFLICANDTLQPDVG